MVVVVVVVLGGLGVFFFCFWVWRELEVSHHLMQFNFHSTPSITSLATVYDSNLFELNGCDLSFSFNQARGTATAPSAEKGVCFPNGVLI